MGRLFAAVQVLILVAGLYIFTGCHDNVINREGSGSSEKFRGSGNLVFETRQVHDFTSISVEGSVKVMITPSEKEEVKIESDDNIVGKVKTTVHNGVLQIKMEPGSYTNTTVNAYVSLKQLKGLECNGTADFITTQPISTDELTCTINGTANIQLRGRAQKQTIEINGTAKVRNASLLTEETTAVINGAGSVEVHASKILNATISGAGSIDYYGEPATINKTVNGVGSITGKK